MKLLIDEPPLQVLPGLAKAIGLNEALFLQQLHYWVDKSAHVYEDRRWIYNTASGWVEQFVILAAIAPAERDNANLQAIGVGPSVHFENGSQSDRKEGIRNEY